MKDNAILAAAMEEELALDFEPSRGLTRESITSREAIEVKMVVSRICYVACTSHHPRLAALMDSVSCVPTELPRPLVQAR